jgi:hypothetical protein
MQQITITNKVIFLPAGCGRHIDQALAGLSKDQICSCKDEQEKQHKDLNVPSSNSLNQETELF